MKKPTQTKLSYQYLQKNNRPSFLYAKPILLSTSITETFHLTQKKCEIPDNLKLIESHQGKKPLKTSGSLEVCSDLLNKETLTSSEALDDKKVPSTRKKVNLLKKMVTQPKKSNQKVRTLAYEQFKAINQSLERLYMLDLFHNKLGLFSRPIYRWGVAKQQTVKTFNQLLELQASIADGCQTCPTELYAFLYKIFHYLVFVNQLHTKDLAMSASDVYSLPLTIRTISFTDASNFENVINIVIPLQDFVGKHIPDNVILENDVESAKALGFPDYSGMEMFENSNTIYVIEKTPVSECASNIIKVISELTLENDQKQNLTEKSPQKDEKTKEKVSSEDYKLKQENIPDSSGNNFYYLTALGHDVLKLLTKSSTNPEQPPSPKIITETYTDIIDEEEEQRSYVQSIPVIEAQIIEPEEKNQLNNRVMEAEQQENSYKILKIKKEQKWDNSFDQSSEMINEIEENINLYPHPKKLKELQKTLKLSYQPCNLKKEYEKDKNNELQNE